MSRLLEGSEPERKGAKVTNKTQAPKNRKAKRKPYASQKTRPPRDLLRQNVAKKSKRPRGKI